MVNLLVIANVVKGVASHNPFQLLKACGAVGQTAIAFGGFVAITSHVVDYFSANRVIERNHAKAARDIKSFDLKFKVAVSKGASKYLEKLVDAELAIDLELDDSETPIGMRVPYKYSRQARQDMKYPGYSADNKRVAVDKIRRLMVEDGLRPSQISQYLPLAATLTFVKSMHEVIAESVEGVLKNTDRWDSSTVK